MPTKIADSDLVGALVARVKASMLPPPDARREIRARAGVSLRAMGAALQVTPMTVLRWERGQVRPSGEHAARYRRLLDELESVLS